MIMVVDGLGYFVEPGWNCERMEGLLDDSEHKDLCFLVNLFPCSSAHPRRYPYGNQDGRSILVFSSELRLSTASACQAVAPLRPLSEH